MRAKAIHNAVNEDERSIRRISESLNLREDTMSEIVARTKRNQNILYLTQSKRSYSEKLA